MNVLWDPKMHKYAHFVEFGGPINSAVGPKKISNTTEMCI